MSAWLYFELVKWDGRGGHIAHLGRMVAILSAPIICGVQVVSINYAPEAHLRRIRFGHDAERDMTDEEAEDAENIMRAVWPPVKG